MPTWLERVYRARDRWPEIVHTANGLEIRAAPVTVRLVQIGARLEITAPIAGRHVLAAETALQISGELGAGSICLRDGLYISRELIELPVDLDALDAAMGRVAYVAVELARQLVRGASNPDCFANYTG